MGPKRRPRSKKESTIVKRRGNLGESSGTEDDSDANETGPQKDITASFRGLPKASEAFNTPEQDSNATDYGLEFTTSRIQSQQSPRRCSTLRTGSSQEEQTPKRTTTRQSKQEDLAKKDIPVRKTTRHTASPSVSFEQQQEYERNDATESAEVEQGAATSKRSTRQSEQSKEKPSANENVTVEQAKSTLTSSPQKSKKQARPQTKQNAQNTDLDNETRQSKPKQTRKQQKPQQLNARFLRDVKYLQNRTEFLIPRLPFSRVVREILMSMSQSVTHVTPTALEALQASSEMYLTQRLQDAYMLTLHRGRVTLDVRDMQLINFLKMYL
ncbi:histone H3-like centromeric protein cid [Stomoxys calcitrans]|uniref:histone H3-like centromeric protein cid n=1 Tax=Stomoxys calcitrans TaxID=35570 RepID=UPI0027E24AF8|nr:histone H3-like centromeric protein cid [Stomoxys calcitrans]